MRIRLLKSENTKIALKFKFPILRKRLRDKRVLFRRYYYDVHYIVIIIFYCCCVHAARAFRY